MMFLAAYLYLAGALAMYLYAGEIDAGSPSFWGFIAVVICWPVLLPAVVGAAILNEVIRALRRWEGS